MDEIISRYRTELDKLKANDLNIITRLAQIAKDVKHTEFVHRIADITCRFIFKVDPSVKLPALYVVDCIVKTVGQPYVDIFSKNLVVVFQTVFTNAKDEAGRMQLFKLRNTWGKVFPKDRLLQLDKAIKIIDPNWPIVGESKSSESESKGDVNDGSPEKLPDKKDSSINIGVDVSSSTDSGGNLKGSTVATRSATILDPRLNRGYKPESFNDLVKCVATSSGNVASSESSSTSSVTIYKPSSQNRGTSPPLQVDIDYRKKEDQVSKSENDQLSRGRHSSVERGEIKSLFSSTERDELKSIFCIDREGDYSSAPTYKRDIPKPDVIPGLDISSIFISPTTATINSPSSSSFTSTSSELIVRQAEQKMRDPNCTDAERQKLQRYLEELKRITATLSTDNGHSSSSGPHHKNNMSRMPAGSVRPPLRPQIYNRPPIDPPPPRAPRPHSFLNTIPPPVAQHWRVEVPGFDAASEIGFDPRLLSLVPHPKPSIFIRIESRKYLLHLERLQPLVTLNASMRAVRFRLDGPVHLVINDNVRNTHVRLPPAGYTMVSIRDREYSACLGGPAHELIIDGVAHTIPLRDYTQMTYINIGGHQVSVRLHPHSHLPKKVALEEPIPQEVLQHAAVGLFGSPRCLHRSPHNPLQPNALPPNRMHTGPPGPGPNVNPMNNPPPNYRQPPPSYRRGRGRMPGSLPPLPPPMPRNFGRSNRGPMHHPRPPMNAPMSTALPMEGNSSLRPWTSTKPSEMYEEESSSAPSQLNHIPANKAPEVYPVSLPNESPSGMAPPTTVTASNANAIVPVASPDITSLYKRLIEIGIIQQTTVTKEEIDLNTGAPRCPPPLDLLRKYNPGEVEALYMGQPCVQCGQRFPSIETEEYQDHLDYHYRKNALDRTGTRYRNFYLPIQYWLVGRSAIAADLDNNDEDMDGKEESCEEEEMNDLNHLDNDGQPKHKRFRRRRSRDTSVSNAHEYRCKAFVNDALNACAVCKEKFESIWDDEEEEWMLPNAICRDGQVYHPVCMEDAGKVMELPEASVEATSPKKEVKEELFHKQPEGRTKESSGATVKVEEKKEDESGDLEVDDYDVCEPAALDSSSLGSSADLEATEDKVSCGSGDCSPGIYNWEMLDIDSINTDNKFDISTFDYTNYPRLDDFDDYSDDVEEQEANIQPIPGKKSTKLKKGKVNTKFSTSRK